MDPKEKFLSICRERIHREGLEDLLAWLEKSDFFTAPASSRYHNDHQGGLVEHSINVYEELLRLMDAYGEIDVSLESAAISALFHDLCKVNFYTVEKRNRKNDQGQWESYDYYTIKEKFAFGGHGSKSVFLVSQFMKLRPEEAVAINCHMGIGDGDKYVGSSYEQFPLAWLVHVADEAATFLREAKR